MQNTLSGAAGVVSRLGVPIVALLALRVSAGTAASEAAVTLRYQEAWYQENGLQDLEKAMELYRSVADAEGAEPAVAARALLRLAACYRELGNEDEASKVEVAAQRRFPDEIKRFPTYRLGVLIRKFDEALTVSDTATAGQAVVDFLEGLDLATVHSLCERTYEHAERLRRAQPLDSIPVFRRAVAISTYLGQLERSAFAQKTIGDVYAAAGRYDEAIAAYRKAQQDYPQAKNPCAWAQLSIAEVHRLNDRLAEAVEAYRAVEHDYLGQTAQVLWATLWMGDAFRAAGKLADAQAAWRRVLEELNEPAYADRIAIAALLLGQASSTQEPPFHGDEFDNDVAYFLAVRYEMAGQLEQARRAYRRCIQLSKDNDWPRALSLQALESLSRPAEDRRMDRPKE